MATCMREQIPKYANVHMYIVQQQFCVPPVNFWCIDSYINHKKLVTKNKYCSGKNSQTNWENTLGKKDLETVILNIFFPEYIL